MRKECPLNREEGHPCSTALLRRAPSASQQLQARKPCSPWISHFEGEDDSVTKKGAMPRPKLSGALLQYTGATRWNSSPGAQALPFGQRALLKALSPSWGAGQAAQVAQEAWCSTEVCVVGERQGAEPGHWDVCSEHAHLNRSGAVQLSGDLGPGQGGQELQACEVPGSRALPTHLAEAAKAGQCRFAERKVSHCGRQERAGVSLRAGGSPGASGSVQHALWVWPWWSGHQWPWWVWPPAPSPAKSVSWTHGLTDDPQRQHVYWENPPLPLAFPPSLACQRAAP